MGFDSEAMDTPKGLGFTEVCRAVGGMTGETSDSMLSSLPSELCFNDLRDSGKRHSKNEKTTPQNIHSIAHKSSCARLSGGQALTLSPEDWQPALSQKYIKARVHSTLKSTDCELGISSEGLTKHRSSKEYTKPHILSQRLDLMRLMSEMYSTRIREELTSQEDRNEILLDAYQKFWVSKLVPEHYFISWNSGKDEDERLLVLGSGPYSVRVLPLVKYSEGLFTFKDMCVPRSERIVGDIGDVVVAQTQPRIAGDQLGWSQASEWQSLPNYIANESILWVPRGLFSKVCTALGLKHGKMDYKARVRLFLQHLQKSEQYITETLEEIPDAPASKPKPRHAEDSHL